MAGVTVEENGGQGYDFGTLLRYLEERCGIRGEIADIIPCSGGNSNLTFQLRLADRNLILRMPPSIRGSKVANDMSREFKVLSAISPVYHTAPEPILHCADLGIIGREFLVMEMIEGTIVRNEIPPALDRSREMRASLLDSFVENLATLHSLNFDELGLSELWKGLGYVARQVDTWTSNYERVRSAVIPDMENASDWLRDNTPEDSARCLIHNDYKLDNLVLDDRDPSKIVGVLDWEMATIGDPLMDLGMTLAYWIPAESAERLRSLPFNPRGLMDEFNRDAIIERYVRFSGRNVGDMRFHHAFGLFKAATIAQSIYFRNSSDQTARERFSAFPSYVEELARLAIKAIEGRW